MAIEIPPEKFWELYKTLPEDLKETLSAATTGNEILDICQKNGAEDKFEEILDCATLVLIGLSPPDEFQLNLEKELKLESELAKKIAREINRYIFYPVKASLEELYGKEIVAPARPSRITPPSAEKPEERPVEDIYREPIE